MGEIIMPKMGDAMTEGKVVRWYKNQGDAVKKGEPVVEIETDKVNLDLEAEDDGVVTEVAAEAGAMVPVGGRLAMIQGEGEASASPRTEHEPKATKKKSSAEYPEVVEVNQEQLHTAPPAPTPQQKPAAASSGRIKSSPLARRLAIDLGVNIEEVPGTGPGGRIVAEDVKKVAGGGPRVKPSVAPRQAAPSALAKSPQPPATLEAKDVPLTAMRRTIAKRLVESIGPIPHFYLTIDADVTKLLSLREQFSDIDEMKVSVNDFVIRAAALALLKHPNVNASFTGEAIRQHGEVHIGIAVATDEGLLTPVIRNADTKSIPAIAGEVRDLATRARNRKLKPDEYQGSTFTISNLGMFGIDEFTAIINPPNSAILAVGAAVSKPVVVDGDIVVRDRMKVTMSCDHRVIDGAAGAEFLKTLRQYLEQPLRLVV